jgi:eukaryotic-like serine/threonine-protein kinase
MIPVAEAISYAHEQGLVHRDLKPENILLDTKDQPHIADFGLAVHQDDRWPGQGEVAGSPAYMAPEQVRGETHRLNGRTDVWALGVILYRMLTGTRPFEGANTDEVFDEILNRDPVPVRQRDRSVPKELERICMKCLSKRMTDRYGTAGDFAEDLRYWLRSAGRELLVDQAGAYANLADGEKTPRPIEPIASASGMSSPARVRPKGLRAFDDDDRDFFLGLLPGPRDRDGLPESLRFWKVRIESGEHPNPFTVGLLSGPSGCGKTSMVRAGLLCRLSPTVIPVYVEASPGTTESRLLASLERVAAGRAGKRGLAATVAGMRTRALLPQGRKVLIVLDQFEQWLHADYEVEGELAQALRQCDGINVQCLVLVRDDFAMVAARLMHALEIRLVESHNFATVDLFDLAHARAVLRAFGVAYDRFRDSEKGSRDRFLDQAVVELAQDGKVTPVRLALFSQMIKDKPWTQATLRAVGGLEGIGATFLEESLAGPAANPEHRLHQQAARRVLRAVLPEGGADIKGHMRSYQELKDASGYAQSPRDFDTLLEILSTELRLITPTDPGGSHPDDVEQSGHLPGRYYHLTHDYLVSSVRSWLTRKQRETQRGRAEIRLSAITNLWKDRPSTRRLPSLLEWLEVLVMTRPRFWSTDERRMIRAATRHYLTGLGLAVCLIIAAMYAFREFRARERSAALLARAVKAELRQVPDLLGLVSASWQHLLPSLERLEKETAVPQRERRMVALLLYSGDPTEERAAVLHESLVAARPDEVATIRDVLAMHPDRSGADSLKQTLLDESTEPAVRLRAACVLAKLRPADVAEQDNLASFLTQALLAEDRRSLGGWIELLTPSLGLFLAPLSGICRDPQTDSTMLSTAAEALGEALVRRGDSVGLGRAVVESRPEASNILRRDLSRLEHPGPALDFMRAVLKEEQADESRKEQIASWKVNACVALASVGEPQALWPQLGHRPDPRVRALLIRRIGASGLNLSVLVERLTAPDLDPLERQALLLGFAETAVTTCPAHTRNLVADCALRLYEEDPHAAVCSAAELLLRRWGRPPIPYAEDHDRTAVRTRRRDSPGRQVGPNGHVFAVMQAPLEFRMGSPEYERGRANNETLHFRRINRTLAVATKELTIEQFRKFAPASYPGRPDDREPGYPATDLSWYDAVGYCNWLSKEAGIDPDQWCYPATILPGMRISAAAVDRYGYRLPTEAEWEYLCRAGTETSRPFGVSEDSLAGFAWTWLNSGDAIHATGALLPNEFGLFDVLGNLWEWCHDGPLTDTYERRPYPAATRDHPASDSLVDETITNLHTWRALRGGAFDYTPATARSAHRDVMRVEKRDVYLGMRVVRTLPPAGQP